ncbi:TPA: ATP-binding protein, partial [Enterobacter hormaechei]|nr:ATP-binding protein [Enterobacter hormaechei]HDR1947527.1 AAA family ATPase [Enterobacter hormaechei]
NVRTSVSYQGHGIIRCTAFQLIRFIQDYLNAHEESQRSTILCFEEPEIYLHPAAASQMRDTIYQFASGISQIVATTHSPYMINLGSDTSLSLTKFSVSENDFTSTHSFNLEKAFTSLTG